MLCPCCKQPTDHPGVILNEVRSLQGRIYDAHERLAKLARGTTKNHEAEAASVRWELAKMREELRLLKGVE